MGITGWVGKPCYDGRYGKVSYHALHIPFDATMPAIEWIGTIAEKVAHMVGGTG